MNYNISDVMYEPGKIPPVCRKVKGKLRINKKNLQTFCTRANKCARLISYFSGMFDEDGKEEDENLNSVENSVKKSNHTKISNGLPNKPVIDVTKRLRGLTEIMDKLEEIKGKKMNSALEARYKKNLKTRLTKKLQKKERKKKILKKRIEKKQKVKEEKRAAEIERDAKKGIFHKEKVVKKVDNLELKSEDTNGNKRILGEEKGKKRSIDDVKTTSNKQEENRIVYNKDAKMVFSRIDFSDVTKEKRVNKKRRKLESDPKFILKGLQKNEEMLSELEKSGEKEKANQIKEKQLWNAVLKKSEGVKVKDDQHMLKKSVRKQKEMTNRRKKKWKSRVDATEKKMAERQTKRKENLAAKKLEKKKKKIKQSIKKGRVVL